MKTSKSLSRILNSIQLSHSEHVVIKNLLYPIICKSPLPWPFLRGPPLLWLCQGMTLLRTWRPSLRRALWMDELMGTRLQQGGNFSPEGSYIWSWSAWLGLWLATGCTNGTILPCCGTEVGAGSGGLSRLQWYGAFTPFFLGALNTWGYCSHQGWGLSWRQ